VGLQPLHPAAAFYRQAVDGTPASNGPVASLDLNGQRRKPTVSRPFSMRQPLEVHHCWAPHRLPQRQLTL